jgi:thiamine biosynthesis lipoprotein
MIPLAACVLAMAVAGFPAHATASLDPGPSEGGAGDAPARGGVDLPVSRARFLMGTTLAITVFGPKTAGAAIEAALAEVARLEAVMSNWRDDSEIAALNRSAADGGFRCSPDLFAVVRAAVQWAGATDGAFDPTVEPLVQGLGLRNPADRVPNLVGRDEGSGHAPAAERGAAAPFVGWRHVRLTESLRMVGFERPGMGLDLGGIGKGYALDAAARILAERGAVPALLDFGGQVLVLGDGPDDGLWTVAIASPADREIPVTTVGIASGSVATSGNSERALRRGARRVGHILDPRSGRPARFTGSVTVHAADATSADALSTALFVMGPEHGLAWARQRELDVVYLLVDPSGRLVRLGNGAFEVGPGTARDRTDGRPVGHLPSHR